MNGAPGSPNGLRLGRRSLVIWAVRFERANDGKSWRAYPFTGSTTPGCRLCMRLWPSWRSGGAAAKRSKQTGERALVENLASRLIIHRSPGRRG